jgi:hypothetical protein
MTVRSGIAVWHGSVESGSGTITVGDTVFAAKSDCPVSCAPAGIPEITLTAKLLIADTPRSAPVVAVAPRL